MFVFNLFFVHLVLISNEELIIYFKIKIELIIFYFFVKYVGGINEGLSVPLLINFSFEVIVLLDLKFPKNVSILLKSLIKSKIYSYIIVYQILCVSYVD